GARTRADLVVVRRDASVGAGPSTGDADSGIDGRVDRLAASLVPTRLRSRGVADVQGAFAVRRDYVESFTGTGAPHRQGRPVVSETAAPGRIALAHLEAADSGQSSKGASMLRGPARPVLARAAASRTGRALAFAAAGATGILVNSAALWTFVEVMRLPLLLAAALATQVSTTWNFVLIDRLVYPGPKGRATLTRFLGFAVVNNVVLLLRLPLLSWLTWTVSLTYLVANVVTLVAAFLARFLISDRFLFRSRSSRHDDHAREAAVPPADDHRRQHGAQGGVEPRALWSPRGPGGRPDLGKVDLTA
ncbi:MAG TPA: GtrA family protein, partial [Propionibacteriaceae bacterium]|nr:GtrA family protein [Propionibacteriaceae bacterium]